MMKRILKWFKSYREKRFLQRHRVETWEQYHRKYDPDFDYDSKTIAGLFHGYHSFHLVDTHHVADLFGPIPSSAHIRKWCEENCVGKYRLQELESWCFDDAPKYTKQLGIIDLFVAFKERDDAINYALFYKKEELNNVVKAG